MANQPRADNPHRTMRIDNALWERAQAIAADDGTTTSEVTRTALAQYVKRREAAARRRKSGD